MGRKILGAILLTVAASPAWGYQVRAFFQENSLVEGDGFQTVSVEVVQEINDAQASCLLDVAVSAQQFSNPPSDAATPNVDYTPTTAVLSFSVDPSQPTDVQTFNVPVVDDNLVEVTQFFTAVITNVLPVDCDSGAVFNVDPAEDFFPIVDDDVASLALSVDQGSVTVNEGAGTVNVGVTLTGTANVEAGFFADVTWDLVPGTASTPADYGGPVSGTLNFDQANQTATVSVPIVDDAIQEPTEDFDFVLSNPFAALEDESPLPIALGAATSNVQIVDNDAPGQISFAGEPFQVNETAGNATVTLRRTGGTAGTLTAFYRTADGSATAGSDYQAVSGSVTWADGDAADKTFAVPILDDADGEGDETVLLQADTDSAFASPIESTLTITDDEGVATASFSTTAATASETDGEVVITLVRGGGTAGAVSVDYATEDGTATAGEDYVAAAGTVSWADGDGADKTIVIQLLEDSDQEDAEDFSVNLSNATGPITLGSNSTITITIEANDVTRDIATITTLSPNQRALANWFDQTCPRLNDLAAPTADQRDLADICGVLRDIGTDDAVVGEALDAINPEELLVSTFNALRLTGLQHGNLSQRLNALRNGATGMNVSGLTLEIDGQQIAGSALQEMLDGLIGGGASADEPIWGRWGGFINGRIASGDQDESENEAGFDFDLYAVTVGVDYRIRPNLILGVSAGFGSVDSDYDNRAGGLDIESWNAAVYLTYFRDEHFYLDALATYGDNEYESQRRITFGSGTVDRVSRGDTDGSQFSFGFGSGWDFNRGGFTFGPHFGGYYFDVDVDGFAETGAGGLNVVVGDQSTQSFTVNAGGHLSRTWLMSWGVLIPNARLDWVHEFEDNRETLSFRFANDPFVGDPDDPSPEITLQSNRPDANYFVWSLGLSAQFIHGFSGFVSYQSYAGYGDVSLTEWSLGARWEKTF